MKEPLYRVILAGTIRDGFERADVVEGLASTFKKDRSVFERLLSGTPKPIRTGATLETARKLESLLTKTGAHCSVEPETPEERKEQEAHEEPPEPSAVRSTSIRPEVSPKRPEVPPLPEPGPLPRPATKTTDLSGLVCPRCGYRPTSEADVLVVRGDCPKCGLQVSKPAELEDWERQDDDTIEEQEQLEEIYRTRRPASAKAKALAAVCSFTLFLWVYFWLSVLAILLLHPLRSAPARICLDFPDTIINMFPLFVVSVALAMTSYAIPLVNQGRTWGQWMVDIEVLFTQEARVGGLWGALLFRVLTILLVSVAPGALVLGIESEVELFRRPWIWNGVIVLGAVVGWVVSWVAFRWRDDGRGLLDLATGTLQFEQRAPDRDAVSKALIPLGGVADLWIVVGAVLPFFLKLILRKLGYSV